MTQQIQISLVEAMQEQNFPGTDATRVKHLGDANGHVINYLNAKGNPDSIFIEKRLWDDARAEFEGDIFHTVIIEHYPAKKVYEP